MLLKWRMHTHACCESWDWTIKVANAQKPIAKVENAHTLFCCEIWKCTNFFWCKSWKFTHMECAHKQNSVSDVKKSTHTRTFCESWTCSHTYALKVDNANTHMLWKLSWHIHTPDLKVENAHTHTLVVKVEMHTHASSVKVEMLTHAFGVKDETAHTQSCYESRLCTITFVLSKLKMHKHTHSCCDRYKLTHTHLLWERQHTQIRWECTHTCSHLSWKLKRAPCCESVKYSHTLLVWKWNSHTLVVNVENAHTFVMKVENSHTPFFRKLKLQRHPLLWNWKCTHCLLFMLGKHTNACV